MFDKLLLLALSGVGLMISMIMIANFLRSELNFYHPFVILFLISIIDVYFPGLTWALNQVPVQPAWVDPVNYYDVSAGTLVYLVSYLIMVIGYVAVGYWFKQEKNSETYLLKDRFLIFSLWILLVLCIVQLLLTIQSYGSLAEWFYGKILVRWDGGLGSERETSVLEVVPFRIVFSMLVTVGFYYRKTLNKSFLLGLLFPVIGLLLAAATFFRGSMLVYILGLLFVERLRLRHLSGNTGEKMQRAKFFDPTLVKWTSCALCLFLLYGGLRQQLSAESWGNDSSSQTEPGALARGDGLMGISSIVKYFDSSKNVLFGKTYMDMLLLPVPRAIYPSKPKWYGIDDITRTMGWPESTQSAVTMPGEAYANFWMFGPIAMLLMGVLFAVVNRIACGWGSIGIFLYPSSLLYLVINSNWMSFTGVANQIFPIIFCAVVLMIIFKKQSLLPKEPSNVVSPEAGSNK